LQLHWVLSLYHIISPETCAENPLDQLVDQNY
jgi:hypothetical protein